MQRFFYLFLLLSNIGLICFANPAHGDNSRILNIVVPKYSVPEYRNPNAEDHIALLLPLESEALKRPAEVIKQGFMAAYKQQSQTLPVKVYGTTDQTEDIVANYRLAVQSGAKVIVGPLTHNGVAALSETGLSTVPTIALNTPEPDVVLPENVYVFSLAVEQEVSQIVQIAHDSAQTAIAIAGSSPLDKRTEQSFVDEWQRAGGTVLDEIEYSSELDLTGLRENIATQNPDMIFLAASPYEARLIRPYFNTNIPTYGVSHIYSGKPDPEKNVDLNDIIFVDMPWLLQPDHPAVMIYPRPDPPLPVELERLYALGIDALRLAVIAASGKLEDHDLILDGVTGKISMGEGHQLIRRLTAAQFKLETIQILGTNHHE